MEWTRADTLPKEWGSYLVYSKLNGTETLWFQLEDGWRDERKAGNWYSEDSQDYDDIPKNYLVEYWMPLPTPPEV